jgi:rubredoxin
MIDSIKCPVCGQHAFEEADDFEECPVCGWVNDGVQRADPDYPGGYNRISLNDARKKWKAGRKVWD